MKKIRKKREQKGYVRSQPHNKLTADQIEEIRRMLSVAIPKVRIAKAMGITRMHLDRVIKLYALTGD